MCFCNEGKCFLNQFYVGAKWPAKTFWSLYCGRRYWCQNQSNQSSTSSFPAQLSQRLWSPPPELSLCTALTLDIPAWLTTYLIRLNASVPTPRCSPGIVNVLNNSPHAFDPALVCEERNVNLLKASSDADAPARAACEPAWTHKRSPHGAFSALCGKDGDKWLFSFTPALLWAPSRCLTYRKAHLHLLFFSFFFCAVEVSLHRHSIGSWSVQVQADTGSHLSVAEVLQHHRGFAHSSLQRGTSVSVFLFLCRCRTSPPALMFACMFNLPSLFDR